jgi:hypothetical protein
VQDQCLAEIKVASMAVPVRRGGTAVADRHPAGGVGAKGGGDRQRPDGGGSVTGGGRSALSIVRRSFTPIPLERGGAEVRGRQPCLPSRCLPRLS